MRRALLMVAALAVLAVPVARATPLRCASPCSVQTFSFGYVPPVSEIASGTEVLWATGDASHPTSDSLDNSSRCFSVPVGEGVTPVPVRFDVAGGEVSATVAPGTPDEITKPCGTAIALETGDFALTYRCLLHFWMVGGLVIAP